MAKVTSGSFNTGAYGDRYLVFSWSAAQDIASNKSTITWTLKGAGGSTTKWYETGNVSVVIAGETVYSSSARFNLYNGTVVASGTKVIYHNTDGTKSFSASAQAGIYYYDVNCTGSGSWELADIPRAATITSAPNFNDELSPTVSFSNPAGSAVTALDICITLSGSADDVKYRAVNKTGSSYTFALTDAERKTLRAATTGANSRSVGFYLRTTIGSNVFYSKVWRTFSIVNGAPTLSISAVDTGGNSTALTGNGSKYLINGFNVVKVSTGAVAKKEASITSQSIKCGVQTINAASGSFVHVNTTDGKVTFTATDSRKNTVTATKTFTVIPYFKPTLKMAKNNVTTAGVYTISVNGTFFNGSFGAVTNALTLQYRWKAGGEDWGEWATVTPTIDGNNYSFSGDKTDLDYKEQYSVQVRVIDSLLALDGLEVATDIYTASAVPVFDWGKNDFKHNTDVYFKHNKRAYGTTTEGKLVNAIEYCDVNNQLAIGYGFFSDNIGPTSIYGQAVNIRHKNGFAINGAAMNDFVVEQGTSGIWSYRKWNSGIAECWGVSTITTDIAASWGGGYMCSDGATAKALSAYFPSGLFTSVINTSAICNNAGKLLFTCGSDYTKDKLNYYIWSAAGSYTGLSVKVNFSAVGRWK